jgi:hypothetical protein
VEEVWAAWVVWAAWAVWVAWASKSNTFDPSFHDCEFVSRHRLVCSKAAF